MPRTTRAQSKLARPPDIPSKLPEDLPAPSTSRNLHPRSRATSLARSETHSAAGSRSGSRGSSLSRGSSVSGSRSRSRRTSLAQMEVDHSGTTAGIGIPAGEPMVATMNGFENLNQQGFLSYPSGMYSFAGEDNGSPSAKRKRESSPDTRDALNADAGPRSNEWEPGEGPSRLPTADSGSDGRQFESVDTFTLESEPPSGSEMGSSNAKKKREASVGNFSCDIPNHGPQSTPHPSQQSRHMDSDSEMLFDDTFGLQSQSTLDAADMQENLPQDKGKGKEKDYKGKGKDSAKALATPTESNPPIVIRDTPPPSVNPGNNIATTILVEPDEPTKPPPDPLSSYTCPICFSPPTNATLTPCGHICCGLCLFTAVKTTIQRAALSGVQGAPEARCPVCRAVIPGWDGKGGGVIGLKARAIFSL